MSPLTAVATDEEPQGTLFHLPPTNVTERRVSLVSVKSVPLHDETNFSHDQPVRFDGVGDIKGTTIRRGVLVYEVEAAELNVYPI